MEAEEIHWRGVGRWVCFAVAFLFVVVAIPYVMTNEAAAGWNISLGLLLFGVIASGSRRAPLLVAILVGLNIVRIVEALVVEHSATGAATAGVVVLLLVFAWRDLRQQAASAGLATVQQSQH